MTRVRAGKAVAEVRGGKWSGDPDLAELGASLEPVGGVSAAFPDPDYVRAVALAEAAGGKVLDPAERAEAPPAGAVE